MGFKLVESTTEPVLRSFLVTNNEAITAGEALMFASGRLTLLTNGSAVGAIATHSVVAGIDKPCVVVLPEPGQVWSVGYTGTPDATFLVGMATADIDSTGLLINAADVTGGSFAVIEIDTATTTCKVVCKDRQLS